MSLSIGVRTSNDGHFYDIRELSVTAEEVRHLTSTEIPAHGLKSHVSSGRP